MVGDACGASLSSRVRRLDACAVAAVRDVAMSKPRVPTHTQHGQWGVNVRELCLVAPRCLVRRSVKRWQSVLRSSVA